MFLAFRLGFLLIVEFQIVGRHKNYEVIVGMKIVITEESQRMAQSDAKYEFQRRLDAICNCSPPSCCSDLFKLEKLLCGAYEHEHRLRKWHFHPRNRFHTCSGRTTEAEEYSTSELEHWHTQGGSAVT
jgi:hypothetical protein